MDSKRLEELNMKLDRLFHDTGYSKDEFVRSRKSLDTIQDDEQYDRACIGLSILWIVRLTRLQEQNNA